MKRRRSEYKVIHAGEWQILERCLHRNNGRWYVPAQLSHHRRVWLGGGHHDSTCGECTRRLAGSRPDLEGARHWLTGVVEYLIDQLVGIAGPKPFIRRRGCTETERAAGHLYILTRQDPHTLLRPPAPRRQLSGSSVSQAER